MGALLSVARTPRKVEPIDQCLDRPVHNPHALPLFKAPPSAKRKREKDRKDPIKSHRPDLPVQGPGYSGRLGSSLTQHIMKNIVKKNDRNEDPREAILKYASAAEKNPYWFKVYQTTQPKPIFDLTPEEDDDDDDSATTSSSGITKK